MVVLDASCLVAYFLGEPGGHAVKKLLEDAAAMSVINRAEVLDQLGRRGASFDDLIERIEPLGVNFIAASEPIADTAAALRTSHYHRTTCPISLADCVALATALTPQPGHQGPIGAIATSDNHFAQVAWQEGLTVVAIPNSQGIAPRRTP